MKITLRQLEVFVAIVKIGNMSRAAEALHLSQSACSMALNTLEQQLNGELFDRHNKKLVINDRGKKLFYRAINLLEQASELEDIMLVKATTALSGTLNVGASTTIGNYVLPLTITHFMTRYPHTRINLKVSNTQEVVEQLLHFNIDIGFIEGSCYHQELQVTAWQQDELIIIAAPHHPLANKKKITLKDLLEQQWIFRETGSGTREKFEEAIGTTITPFVELGHTEAIKQAVEAGLGISCLSKATVSKALERGELIVIKTPFLKLTRDFYKVIHKEKYQTQLLKRFVEEVS